MEKEMANEKFPDCSGEGKIQCFECGGRGGWHTSWLEYLDEDVTCQECDGKGYSQCAKCNKNGYLSR